MSGRGARGRPGDPVDMELDERRLAEAGWTPESTGFEHSANGAGVAWRSFTGWRSPAGVLFPSTAAAIAFLDR